MYQLLHCVKCRILVRSGRKIYLCGKNHCYCEVCHEKETFNGKGNDKKCSVEGCKKYLYRSIIAEFMVLQTSDIPCDNADLGCCHKDSLKGLQLHGDHCEFIPLPCLEKTCRASKKTLIKHITTEHKVCHWRKKGNVFKIDFSVSEHFSAKKEGELWIPLIFEFQGVNYIFKNFEKNGVWYLWISVNLEVESPKSEFVQIRIGHPTIPKVALTYEGLLEPFSTSPETVIQNYNSLALPLGMIDKFKDAVTGKVAVTYHVNIL